MRYLMLAVFLFASLAYAAPGLQEAPEGNYDLVAVELVPYTRRSVGRR